MTAALSRHGRLSDRSYAIAPFGLNTQLPELVLNGAKENTF